VSRAGLFALVALFALAACSQGENDPGPGAVTMGEARALDEAAEMLEERRLAPEDLRDPASADTAAAQASKATGEQGDAAR
jgi:hypothetical protein